VTSKTSNPTFSKKKPDGIPEGLSPEELERLQKLQSQLTQFILHLIQAFLRTGYYTSEHPESIKAKEGLYQQFKNLFKQEDELTFLVKEEEGRQNILVEGLLPEPQRLSSMMMKGIDPVNISSSVAASPSEDFIAKTTIPNGGVSRPISIAMMLTMPNQIG